MRTVLLGRIAITVALLLPPASFGAIIFTNLHSFPSAPGFPATNEGGANPSGGLVLSGATLYGTTQKGGEIGGGIIFSLNTDGTSFSNLYSFTGLEGRLPIGTPVISSNAFYGATSGGGPGLYGTVFGINLDGSSPTNLAEFTNSQFASAPDAGLILSGNLLYGVTEKGGDRLDGSIYTINVGNGGYSNLFSFDQIDGKGPDGTLLLSGNTLFGTTTGGGLVLGGTVFRINADGTAFTNLHNFRETTSGTGAGTNTDGQSPTGTLVLSGNTLYGTARYAGIGGEGTVFKVNTDGSNFTALHSFGALRSSTNEDGATPWAGLTLSGSVLYGVAALGGQAGNGTVFQINTDGSGFAVVYSFSPLVTNSDGLITNSDGASPYGQLLLSGNTLYGTTQNGGAGSRGTIFALTLPPPVPAVNIQLLGGAPVLSWTDSASAFSLQAATDVAGPYTNVPGATSPYTVAASGTQTFFRLKSN